MADPTPPPPLDADPDLEGDGEGEGEGEGEGLPQSREACTESRRAAEATGDDAALLRLRRLERAYQGLPPAVDGARRQRLLWTDAISTTWQAWEVDSGRPLLLRCLRPFWQDDPVMQRRMARAVETSPLPLRPLWRPHGDWPHLRLALPGPLLSSGPLPPSLSPLSLLVHALQGLEVLHRAGLTLGGHALADHLALTEDGTVALVWLDRFHGVGTPADDLRALARLVARVPPRDAGDAVVPDLLADWPYSPPPSAQDAVWLVRRALSAALLSARRALLTARRQAELRHHHQRLTAAAQRLARAVPPPKVRACLYAPADLRCLPTLALSDGQTLSGGEGALPEALPRLAAAHSPADMDVAGCRALLRAPARQRPAQEPLRQQIQAELGGRPDDHEIVLRWLRARLQLRSLLLLLDKIARARPPEPAAYSRSMESR